ncbi:hypothetical protein ACJX0J_012262 [Zea mays]
MGWAIGDHKGANLGWGELVHPSQVEIDSRCIEPKLLKEMAFPTMVHADEPTCLDIFLFYLDALHLTFALLDGPFCNAPYCMLVIKQRPRKFEVSPSALGAGLFETFLNIFYSIFGVHNKKWREGVWIFGTCHI